MADAHPLTPGANAPLGGTAITLDVNVPQLGGATLLMETAGAAVRVLGPADDFAQLGRRDERTVLVAVDLAAVPASVERLRLLVWSPAPALALARVNARGLVDGAPAFSVELPTEARELRAAELLELYRRSGAWKVRAIASGWQGHVRAMARALGLPESTFPVPPRPQAPPPPGPAGESEGGRSAATPRRGLRPPSTPRPAPPSPPAPDEFHEGPSPLVGPPALRDVLDNVIGPGPRFGDDSFVDFALHGVLLRLGYERSGDFCRVIATTPGGEGAVTDVVALAGLRATGEAPLARVSFAGEGNAASAFVSAPAVAEYRQVDTSLVKALLAEVWVTAHRFGQRVRTARWSVPPHLTDAVPRELRLGVAEELQSTEAWAPVRERLTETDCIPLVDEPAAMIAPTTIGQLAIGPCLLAGTPRAWTILVERTVRANVRPAPGLWRALAAHNGEQYAVRVGVQAEGLPGDPPAIQVGFSALQLPRTQVFEDLGRGLEMVDEAADSLEPMLRDLAADSSEHRNNLPWTATRRWTGPGSELRDHLLVREIVGLPAAAPVPVGLTDRARGMASTLGRPGFGYLAHLALLRAEAKDAASLGWHAAARDLVALSPVEPAPGDAPCATASIHVRLHRLDTPRPMRFPPPPAPTTGPTAGPAPAKRRRRRLFG